jgi:ABC-type phosphate transport system substrate-binding protein
MSRFRAPRPAAVNALLGTIAVALLLAACGGASGGLPTAGGVGSAAPPRASSGSGGSTDPAEAWSAWAACLRSQGLAVADPSIDPHGAPQFAPGLDLEHLVTPAMHTACDPLIQSVTANKGSGSTYTFDSLVAFAGCLRQHGLPNYPDPDPNAPQGLAPGYDKADPTVTAAIDACHDLLVRTGDAASTAP